MAGRSPYVANYIPKLQARGLSANAALGELRAAGLGVQRATFLRLWGEELAASANRTPLATQRQDLRPSAENITPLTTKYATGYRYTVDVAAREATSGAIYHTPIAVRTDKLVSLDRARQMALGALQAGLDVGGNYEFDKIYGGVVTEVRELDPTGDEGDLFG